MKRRAINVCVGLLVLMPAFAMAGQPLGRLFFTPEQRAKMDMARQQERSIRVEEEVEASPPPANITLNGVITRSDGKTVVWINNRVQGDDASGKSIAVAGRENAGQISVTTPDAKRSIPLKVGQSLDMNSGQVEEVYRRTSPPLPPKTDASALAPGTEKSPATLTKPPTRKDDTLDAPADAQGEILPSPR